MLILILNWSGGENDPFTYFSQQLQRKVQALGHDAFIVPLEGHVIRTVVEIHTTVAPIDLVLTWQGLGSSLQIPGQTTTLWEHLEIPVVCLHGDHPCYNPANHQQSSPFLFHVYSSSCFATAANRCIAREWPAIDEVGLNFFASDEQTTPFDGDYFVFPKNVESLADIRADWRRKASKAAYDMLMRGADSIESAYRTARSVNHHELILDLMPPPIPQRVRAGTADEAMRHLVLQFSRELDRIYRNVAAAHLIDTLADVPIRVHGRGWESFAARGNPHHQFLPALNVADSGALFRSAYGILDVAPNNDGLHDRTLRAMRIGAGFLIGTAWNRSATLRAAHSSQFFSPDDLPARVDAVRQDPSGHRDRSRAFGEAFEEEFPFPEFFGRILDHVIARGVGRFRT